MARQAHIAYQYQVFCRAGIDRPCCYLMVSGNCDDGVEAAAETEGDTGKAHMEVLYLLPEFCTYMPQ